MGWEVRREGVGGNAKRLTAYGSKAVHGCVAKALDFCGLGSAVLRLIETDRRGRMELRALEEKIQEDRAAGHWPFLVVGSAGTVDTGAIDDLAGVAEAARREKL